MEHESNSEEETTQIANDFAKELRPGDMLLLHGNLGSGKTVFARALIRALTKNTGEEVPSPTFTLVQNYDTDDGMVWHFDLYRLKDAEEIYELGWEEALADHLTIIEWPERLGALKPPHYLDIHLTNTDNGNDSRRITITRVE